MKVNCDRQALADALTLVSSVVNNRSPKPALACVKFSAAKDSLTLAASDAETFAIVTTRRVEVGEVGEALLPAAKAQAIASEMGDATVSIETKGEEAVLSGPGATFRLLGYPASDFPAAPTAIGAPDFEVEGGTLSRIVASTLFATAKDNSRYAIAGVLLERDGNDLVVVATDGHRLALARGKCSKGGTGKSTAIVPTKALNLLLKMFTDPEAVIGVKVSGNQISFQTRDAVLTSNLVEGNFPPYRDVIPKDSDKKATLAIEGFRSAVRRAALLTNEESRGVKLAFQGKELVLSSRAPETGEAEVRIATLDYAGEPLAIGFSPAYLIDALKALSGKQFTLEMKAPNKPGILRDGEEFLYVVMPVSLS